MAYRGAIGTLLFAVVAGSVPSAAASSDKPVIIEGVGAAHGFGMAMDGVEGQARGGWSHERILDLFYPGTTTGRAGGTIRVGLASEPTVSLTLPHGGVVSDAPKGAAAGSGYPATLPPGGNVTLSFREGKIAVSGVATKRAAPTRAAAAKPAQEPPSDLLPTPPPVEAPTPAPPSKPKPKPPPKPTPADDVATGPSSVWAWGLGDPALVGVSATGRRYRGTIEVKPRDGKLTVVNHVDLETYTAGIAEEKGQAWPLAGLKALAIAARSLGAATMSWYTKNQANGYDICPTGSCQVYLGYDGEEPAMSRAVAETAGQIRTFGGRPILAMYHGNGGGQTESYKRAIGGGSDPHPYLRSVKYPFADPSRWEYRTTLAKVDSAIRAAGLPVPAGLASIRVDERGESPRVMTVELRGTDGETTVPGMRFAEVLELRSTWFDVRDRETTRTSAFVSADIFAAADPASRAARAAAAERSPWPVVATIAFALGLLGVALRLRGSRLAG